MATELDYCEYADDPAAQAAYPTNGTHAVTFVNTAQLDTTEKKYGSSSLKYDGDSDYITIPDSSDFSIFADNTETWTIRFFVKHTDHVGYEFYIGQYHADNYWVLFHHHGDGIRLMIDTGGVERINTGYVGEIDDNDWHCITIVKIAQEWGLYKDTDQIGYDTDATEFDFTTLLILAKHPDAETWYFDGWHDDILIEKGNPFGATPVIGLTDTIAAPTAPYIITTDTKLMLHCDGTDEAQAMIDSSRCEAYSDSTLEVEGTYCLKGFADTDALNDTLTRTVAPTIDLSGLGEIKYGIYSNRTGSNIKIGIHDSGSTTTEHTANISSAGAWETQTWDISGVADVDKDDIDSIIITIVNADADTTFYIDNMYAELPTLLINVHDCTDLVDKVVGG